MGTLLILVRALREQATRARGGVARTHGNAFALYFFDPEHNRCEVYWGTGLRARQPYLEAVDLDQSKAAIVRERKVLAHTKAAVADS